MVPPPYALLELPSLTDSTGKSSLIRGRKFGKVGYKSNLGITKVAIR
jgi:hypothetical protein